MAQLKEQPADAAMVHSLQNAGIIKSLQPRLYEHGMLQRDAALVTSIVLAGYQWKAKTNEPSSMEILLLQ